MPSNAEVADFVRGTFRSVWALELLILLRQNRERKLTVAEMVAALRGSELVVAQSLEALVMAGLVVVDSDGLAQYAPASKPAGALVEATERFYASSPNAVRRMIVSASSSGLSAFADAFRLWKD